MKRWKSIVGKTIAVLISLFLLLVMACNVWVIGQTRDKVYSGIREVPFNHVALILGTSKYSREGKLNKYFNYRIEAAAKLYYYKKIRHIIVSGDNSLSYYNEPADMRKALIAKGVPDSIITMDHAGFRTFDSVVRSKKVFNQNNITIITQKFHVYRALFISDFYGMKAIGFVAENSDEKTAIMTEAREYLARFLAVLDLYVFKKTPKFLGKKEDITFN